MKNMAITLMAMLITGAIYGQNTADKRGFKGVLTSSLKQELRYTGDNVSATDEVVETKITFTGRTIIFGNDTYEIVKRSFDGKATSFTATKRRATFDIIYIAGKSITIKDQSNPALGLSFTKLKE